MPRRATEIKALKVRQFKLSGLDEVAAFLKKRAEGPVGFDTSMSHAQYLRLKKALEAFEG